MSVLPVILSGGCGSRLWPVSRKSRPKQFLDLGLGTSLFRNTLDRVSPVEIDTDFLPLGVEKSAECENDQCSLFDARPIVVSNTEYKYLIAEELLLAGCRADVLLEPVGRNSCPAIAVACLQAVERNPDAIVLVMPSDHDIPDASAFKGFITEGMEAAEAGRIVLFGLTATSPHTGYGYIECDRSGSVPYRVSSFIEKPDSNLATRLLAEGRLWNTGYFLMRADVCLNEIRLHAPDVLEGAASSIASAVEHPPVAGDGLSLNSASSKRQACGLTPTRFLELAAEPLENVEVTSFDHAVLEKTGIASVLPVELEWRDLGNWESVSHQFRTDNANNRLNGSICTCTSSNNVVQSTERLTALLGVDNLIVVDTPDALLIADRERAGELDQLVDELSREGLSQATEGVEHVSPWGRFTRLETSEHHQVKRLTVLPGASLSLQAHSHRSEYWVVIEGQAEVVVDNRVSQLQANEFIQIPAGSLHRLTNCGNGKLVVIEVQTGNYFGEDDIIRYDDIYNRV